MSRTLPRFSRILLATATTLISPASAVALAQPAPSPVPVPYPLVNEARAAEPSPTGDAAVAGRVILCIPVKICLPKAAGTLQLQASAGESGGKQIEVLAWGWGAVDFPPAGSADPQEGGEIVGGVDDRATAEASSRKRGDGRVTIGELRPTMKVDKATPVLMSNRRIATKEPGTLEVPNLRVAPDQAEPPPPSGMVTLLVPAGTCVQGAHYPTVTLQSEGKAYELHDVTVAECAPTSVARGRKADKQKLQYLKVKMKEILVSG